MELQFKTIHQHKLVSCEISTFENLVFVETGNFYNAVGRITDKYKLDHGFKILPVYIHTGLKDRLGKAICLSHIVKIKMFGLDIRAIVVWNQEKAGFFLEWNGEQHRMDGIELEIVGHIGLTTNGSCGGVA